MEFDITWLLLGLPVAFVLGWVASRLDLRQMRLENQRVPKAYFKGLNYLLNEQQDEAIDAFIEAVQKDPDTTELHFALGNLFRRRGEYARAVRVHEHLLHRGDLNTRDRERAQYALAQDYLKAGLLDRAEMALQALEGTSHAAEAGHALLTIYERARDWEPAGRVAAQLQALGEGDFAARQAHYLCERAAAKEQEGDMQAAEQLLREAVAIAPDAPRAALEWARCLQRQGHHQEALQSLALLAEKQPQALPLGAALVTESAHALQCEGATLEWMMAAYERAPSLDLLEAIIALTPARQAAEAASDSAMDSPVVDQWSLRHLQHAPSLVAATRWLANRQYAPAEEKQWVQKALQRASQPLTRYRCAACGFETRQHFWQCPGCQSWDSYPPKRVDEY